MGTSVWQGERESRRECQIRPPGSLTLHLRVDNTGLPISVNELHQFSGSIAEIDVSFPSLCLSNTALSYLCVWLSLLLWFSSSSWHARWDVYVIRGHAIERGEFTSNQQVSSFKLHILHVKQMRAEQLIWFETEVLCICYTSTKRKLTVAYHQWHWCLLMFISFTS